MSVKKLIEVALPLAAINQTSAKEKSIQYGHPSSMHMWWARRPLATARAVIWASLVDDPSSHPERFPTKEVQDAERQRLFNILEKMIQWKNINNPNVLAEARVEIQKSLKSPLPTFLDPFAGGGAIPLEAQRLGLNVHAHDLNPVAVILNKAMIEIPHRFSDCLPVNSEIQAKLEKSFPWDGTEWCWGGLAEDIRYYGNWIKGEAFRRIGHLYPNVKVPEEQGGGEATVTAWIWARTVKCPNPICGCEMPLIRSFTLSEKKDAWIEPVIEDGKIRYQIRCGGKPTIKRTVDRKGAICLSCGSHVPLSYIRAEGKAGRMGNAMCAIAAEGKQGKRGKLLYLPADTEQIRASQVEKPAAFPDAPLQLSSRDFTTVGYGMTHFSDLFTNRQLTTLLTFGELIKEAREKVKLDAIAAGMSDDHIGLDAGGTGARAYSEAIGVYLSFLISKLADRGSTLCNWDHARAGLRNTFGRQSIHIVWDYAEANPFSHSSGCFDNALDRICRCAAAVPAPFIGTAKQFDARDDCELHDVMISTDPPYYDNINYSGLSDFFYIWMRHVLHETYPDLFHAETTPNTAELIVAPYRFGGDKDQAKTFFEDGMLHVCQRMYQYAREDIPVTIYYAYKRGGVGWKAMLSAIIQAGFSITAAWPMCTERAARPLSSNGDTLTSSIVLVCRKRSTDAQQTTYRDFVRELKRELRTAIQRFERSGVAAADMPQAAIGAGMCVFSKYASVVKVDGTSLTIHDALEDIGHELNSLI